MKTTRKYTRTHGVIQYPQLGRGLRPFPTQKGGGSMRPYPTQRKQRGGGRKRRRRLSRLR